MRFEETTPDDARQGLFADLPPQFVDEIMAAHAAMVTQPEKVTDTVEQLTGTPARTFGEWAADHAADFKP